MTVLIAITFMVLGVACGRYWFSPSMIQGTDLMMTIALGLLIFSASIEAGCNREIFRKLAQYKLRILTIPLGTVIGSALPGILLGFLLGMRVNESAAVALGLGYYSASAGILSELGSAHLGALAFLTNIFREVIALLTIPLAARYCGKYAAIAPAGATSMDTTLPIIYQATDEEVMMLSMINGVLLTIAVPVLVTLAYRFL